jgi:hypothetical protein
VKDVDGRNADCWTMNCTCKVDIDINTVLTVVLAVNIDSAKGTLSGSQGITLAVSKQLSVRDRLQK